METESYDEFYLYDWRENYELLKRIKFLIRIQFYGENCQCAKMDENLRLKDPYKTIQDFQIVACFTQQKMQWFWDCRNQFLVRNYVPSYRATRNEKILRARANVLREYLTIQKENKFNHKEL
jgi:hypothetical protein